MRTATSVLLGLVFATGMALSSGMAQSVTATPAATTVDPRVGCDTIKGFPEPDLGEPENIDTFKKQLLYYRCKAYDDDVAGVLAAAQHWVELRAPQVSKPAIVLDIDETSLLNWPRVYQDDYAYIASIPNIKLPAGKVADVPDCDFQGSGLCGDLDWQQKGLARAVEPTLRLYKAARCLDVTAPCVPIEVFFVTGRRESEYNGEMPSVWTLRNLKAAGYADVAADHLFMRGTAPDGGVARYKASKRAEIEGRGFTVIANIGDQKSDLANGHAEMSFKVPNPFYFIPAE